MRAGQYILSIDLGTSGPKVALVGEDGSIAASAVRAVETRVPSPGAGEQDPEQIWAEILSAAKQVIHEAGKPREAILGITCTSHYFSIVPIDAAGLPVGNLILWLDGRGGRYAQAIYAAHPEALGRWLTINGMLPLPTGNDSLSHMLFIQNEQPEVYERTDKFVEPMDYITTRLTGVCRANPCTAFAQLLTDNRRLKAVQYDEELLALSGIDREKLPELIASNSCVGEILAGIAEEIGLSLGTRVFAGINDTQAVSVGAGSFQPGRGGINVGTTGQLLGFVDELKGDFENSIVSMPSPIAGRYAIMVENGLAGKTIEHFLGQIVFANDALADHSVDDPLANLEKALQSSPSTSEPILYLPWLNGSQSPNANSSMRGGFLNLSLNTTREDLLRSIVEGISFSLRWVLPAVERFTEQRFDALSFAGGGAVSDAWSQILADVMDRPVLQLAQARYINNRATALLAFEQLGVTSLDACPTFCPVRCSYDPRPEHRDRYALLFEQFVVAYEQTRPIFEALNA